MLKRPKEEQDAIASTLSKLGMTMGVFVVDGGDNWKISLTNGQAGIQGCFCENV
jgi:hydroxypyruvate isomerase